MLARDRHWDPSSLRLPPHFERVRHTRASRYVPMRDGARIALEVFLPDPLPARAPAIVRQTRYFRALAPRGPWGRALAPAFDLYARTRRVFLAAGYAWIDVDVRGSGASTGVQLYPWSKDEVRDGADIVDWIVREPWSSGAVGSLGISYDGGASEMLLVNRHPAVRAVAPLFSLHDAYEDVAFPGGVHLAWFTEAWARYNAALDRNAFDEAFAPVVRLIARAALASPAPRGADRLVAQLGRLDRRLEPIVAAVIASGIAGVEPVAGDARALAAAVADHTANESVHEGAKKITYRDDRGLSLADPEASIDALSPRTYQGDLIASGAAVYSVSGFRDGAYQASAIARHAALTAAGSTDHRLTIGPWLHSGKLAIQPFDVAVPTAFDHDAELLGFFDRHLRGADPRGDGRRVHYFTYVEERWKSADAWPPPSTPHLLHLAPGRSLAPSAPTASGSDALRVDPDLGTGERSRWRSMLSLVPGDYPDRREQGARLLVFDGAPLERAIEVTGHPVAVIHASWDGDDDGRLFVYLEDVAPDGRVAYVTEGQLRALHRRTQNAARAPGELPARTFRREHGAPLAAGEVGELALALLPISWRFDRGHRVRLSIAGGDADHFERSRAATLRVHWGAGRPSRLELPVVAG
jgi:putative CocE/NonD family hydrolase